MAVIHQLLSSYGAVASVSSLAWDPSNKGPNVTLSGSNLIADCHTSDSVRGTLGKSSGVWQYEVVLSVDAHMLIGVGNASASLTIYPGGDSNGLSYYAFSGAAFGLGGSTGYSTGAALGVVIGVVADFGAGRMTIYKNGVSAGVITSYSLPAGTLFPMIGDGGIGAPGSRATLNSTLTYPVGGASQW